MPDVMESLARHVANCLVCTNAEGDATHFCATGMRCDIAASKAVIERAEAVEKAARELRDAVECYRMHSKCICGPLCQCEVILCVKRDALDSAPLSAAERRRG